MAELIVAKYSSKDAVTNAYDDLRSAGIPLEKVRIDKERHAISVEAPPTSDSEMMEILRRHEPVEVKRKPNVPA
jgi:hypothetical protein